ncbi:MAG: hypothetical protein AAF674_17535 [Pseudomonadota bacterium]
MSKEKPFIYAFVVFILVALAWGTAMLNFQFIDLEKLKAADLGELFLTLIFTALVIERAVEVLANNLYGTQELEQSRDLRLAQQELAVQDARLTAAIALEVSASGDAAARDAAVQAKNNAIAAAREKVRLANEAVTTARKGARDQLDKISIAKSYFAALAATILGAAAAIVGVRVLGQFLSDETVLVGSQLHYFTLVDVVLTALLLAGGADGIHQLVKNFLGKRGELKAA